jgi:oxygen-independent coproporphyrinogen-3 oxidase
MLLYVHVPFCRSKCHYCAFASMVPRYGDMDDWAATVSKEAAYWGGRLERPVLKSVFFGGGTPSLVPPYLFREVMEALRAHFRFGKGLECSVEANPDSADADTLRGFRELGVNRLSLGVQSLDDGFLKVLGRAHTASQAVHAVHAARDAGFANVSLDMIWGLPGQRLRHWLQDLRAAAGLKPDHLSCYGLTIEPGTRMEALCLERDMEFASEDDQSKMYVYGAEYLESEGLLQYEVSNFGRMGFFCRHNLGYWEGGDYLGLGPSAVSTIAGERWSNPDDLHRWMRAVHAGALAEDREILDLPTRVRELVMLRLRTSRGLRLRDYRALTGRDFMRDHAQLVQALHQHGLVRISQGYLRLTKTGMLVSNTILENFFGSEALAPQTTSGRDGPDAS